MTAERDTNTRRPFSRWHNKDIQFERRKRVLISLDQGFLGRFFPPRGSQHKRISVPNDTGLASSIMEEETSVK